MRFLIKQLFLTVRIKILTEIIISIVVKRI